MKQRKKNKNKKYDNWEFRQAFSSIRTNPIETKIKCEEYIRKYPKDYGVYPYYASALITLGDFQLAKKIIQYLELISNKTTNSEKELKQINNIKKDIVYTKLKILCYEENYEELEQILLNNPDIIKKISVKEVIMYCNMKLGKTNIEERENHSYLFRQIIQYKERDFLAHIRKHQADHNKDNDNPNKNVFIPDFPLEKILEEIKKYIPSDKRLFPGFIDNTYIFKYDGCGRENNKLVDYFKVVCFHNTSNIITIVPIPNCENLPYVDLTYLIKEEENVKVKRKSQIDKFNQRYTNTKN